MIYRMVTIPMPPGTLESGGHCSMLATHLAQRTATLSAALKEGRVGASNPFGTWILHVSHTGASGCP